MINDCPGHFGHIELDSPTCVGTVVMVDCATLYGGRYNIGYFADVYKILQVRLAQRGGLCVRALTWCTVHLL